jgi:hypothetical protein
MHESLEVAPAQDEVQEIDKAAEFNSAIKVLLYYQHKIEDISKVATRFIAEARRHYNHAWEMHKYFLKEYAKEHLKRNKDGEIKGKSYKTIEAGGGVFFRQRPAKITLNEQKLEDLKEFIERYLPDKSEVIKEKVVYEYEPDEIIDVLKQIAEVKAHQLYGGAQEAKEQGMKEICDEFGIEIEEPDPFYYMHVGTTKAFSTAALKANLGQAIDGTTRFDEEEEINLLLEELE